MKINLLQKIKEIANISLNFVGLTTEKTRDGEFIAILQLESPLAHVRGSQEIDVEGKKVPVNAYDVTEVKIHQSDIELADENFEFDTDTDTGSYSGSELVLDVTQQGQVWLRSTSFKASGNKMRTESRNNRLKGIVEAQEKRAKDAIGQKPGAAVTAD